MKEFSNRLAHRSIDQVLFHYQESTNKLLELYMDESKLSMANEFTVEEVQKVIRSFKSGKSSGPDNYPSEIFLNAGPALINMITSTLNHIKRTLTIPEDWFEVIIVTISKNKGTKKRLKYYRGIFLTSILSKIFEKLIKLRIEPYTASVNSLQCGGRRNKSTCDSIFIIKSLIDHAIYLNSKLYISFYDYKTCFDSVWLEDSMLSLCKLGVKDDMLPLNYKPNEQLNTMA